MWGFQATWLRPAAMRTARPSSGAGPQGSGGQAWATVGRAPAGGWLSCTSRERLTPGTPPACGEPCQPPLCPAPALPPSLRSSLGGSPLLSFMRLLWGAPRCLSGEEPGCQCGRRGRCRFDPWVGKIPQRRRWRPTPVFFPGESHGQRSLAGLGDKIHLFVGAA